MKNIPRLLTIIFLISTLASPLHALTYKQWQGITGLGAIGGAIAGIMIYQAMTEKKRPKHHPQETLVIGHHKPQKEKKTRSLLSSFCSGCLGAATGALALGWWFWSKTPQGRQEQAQELINLAQANRFIAQNVDLANPVAVQNTIQEVYPRNGEEFNRALWEMTTYEANLQAARHLCAQAQADAQGDGLLQGGIANTQATINDLLNRVTARAQAIRNNPAYLAQQVANVHRRNEQERIWREAFDLERQRRRNAFAWRWQYEWRQPYVEVIHHNHVVLQPPVHLPRPIVATQPVFIHQPTMPTHHPIQAPRPPYPHIPAARFEVPYAAPPAPMAPTPAPKQKVDHMRDIFLRESSERQRPPQPFPAHQAQARPIHPALRLGRGKHHSSTL